MSPHIPHNASASRSTLQRPKSLFRPFQSSPSSDLDWLATLIFNAKAIAAGAEFLPCSYVQGIFNAAIFLLETVEKVEKNRVKIKELCEDIVDIITVIRDRISFHRDTAALQFKVQCEEFESFLQDVAEAICHRQKSPRGFSARVKEVMKSGSISDEIGRLRDRIREMRLNFMLMTAMDTNFGVQKVLTVLSSNMLVPQISPPINNCPPATRIFHGRQSILAKMHEYFTQNVGGAGKTQIALKFIEESAAWFTDTFLIDASTSETIDTGLKTIATMKNVGDSSKEALQWLKSKQDGWLLLFDNADDPKINLNDYLPQCTHGNILITSRNPGLSVYAGVHCAVSEMEEQDAVELLIRSSIQNNTDGNRETAAQIVKNLCYLPLPIIQAGAFISKSGNLDSYLALYAHNRARLLSQRPAQSHDNYAWTVYTTWQISFDQLSEQAKTFLKLCSFLHYQGISEDIFKNATNYKFGPCSPSKQELEMALTVLSHFLGSSGLWDHFCFTEVTSEIRAYSLINFDSGKNMFSIHPLVHDWTRTTLTHEAYHQCMISIAGMSLTGLSEQIIEVTSVWMVPHLDFLLKGNTNMIPDFQLEYGKVYLFAGKAEKAAELQVRALDKRRNQLGEDHPDTLEAVHWLSWAYEHLGKWKEAAELEVMLLEKKRNTLGEDHPDTLEAMNWLAWAYKDMGQLKKAEELAFSVLQKRKEILGENHHDTLDTMCDLAVIYNKRGKLKEAAELGVRALEHRHTILGENSLKTLTAMGNLAAIYRNLGRLKEAQELGLKVFEKRRSILGENHPDTLRAMGNLAFGYKSLGKLQEAEQLDLIVLEKRRNILGDNHAHTMIAMGNLAATYNKLGRLEEAQELEVVVLQKRENILGDNHPSTLRTMSNLASTFNKLEKWQEAEDLLVKALKKQTEVLSANHPHIIETMQNLAITYTKLGKSKEAEDLNEVLRRIKA
ncbi:hypothetical protein FB451DRAFT_1370710 [Mycena latifolia]|nr:hypothetical protein FB451DRAFT_1370710 [Mycena latifolia]